MDIPPNERTWRATLTLYLKGLVMGSADIVPGVSGGTMALILGIYEELIESVRRLSSSLFLTELRHFNLGKAFHLVNGRFLLVLVAGIGSAILLLSSLITLLLETQQALLYSFFFGLILASVFVVGRRIHKWRLTTLLGLIMSTLSAFVLVGLSPATTPEAGWFLVLSGALAICAMVLPGISGAFILLLLGKYEYVLGAVRSLDLDIVVLFAIGALLGLLSFVRLLAWLLARYHDLTLALLTGFMLGSLRKLWPWKTVGEAELAGNLLPEAFINGRLNVEVGLALLLFAIGIGIVLLLHYFGDKPHSQTSHPIA